MFHRGLILFAVALVFAACGGDSDYDSTSTTPDGGAGASSGLDWRTVNRAITDSQAEGLLGSHCATCHTLTPTRKGRSLDAWITRVQTCMGKSGCMIARSDAQALAHWLYKTYPE